MDSFLPNLIGKVETYSKAYAPILDRAAKEELSELEYQFLRSLAWYRKGRWDTSPTRRFLTYFIAFEHIFAAGASASKDVMLRHAPRLLYSWTDMPLPFGHMLRDTVRRAHELRTEIERNDDLVAAFSLSAVTEWRTDIRSLLKPSLVSGAVTDLRRRGLVVGKLDEYEQALQRLVDNTPWLPAVIATNQAEWRFTLELIWKRRNEVAHEALSWAPDMVSYARCIERALETVLNKISDALFGTAGIHTLDALMESHSIPWQD